MGVTVDDFRSEPIEDLPREGDEFAASAQVRGGPGAPLAEARKLRDFMPVPPQLLCQPGYKRGNPSGNRRCVGSQQCDAAQFGSPTYQRVWPVISKILKHSSFAPTISADG